jgi:hypothetical protein
MVIHVRCGHGVDPYFDIPMPKSRNGWRKQWLYLRNDADAPLHAFTSNWPIPQSNWGMGWQALREKV